MKKNILTALLLSITLASCASNTKTQEVVEKKIEEVQTPLPLALNDTIMEKISSSNLSKEQKDKLVALEKTSRAKYLAITDELEKTKVVMVDTPRFLEC